MLNVCVETKVQKKVERFSLTPPKRRAKLQESDSPANQQRKQK